MVVEMLNVKSVNYGKHRNENVVKNLLMVNLIDKNRKLSYLFLDLLLMRRHYLGDRGENEGEIEQSENELTAETKDHEEEQTNDEDVPPPLEDIDESESEEENEIIEPSTETVAMEKPKEDDTGKF